MQDKMKLVFLCLIAALFLVSAVSGCNSGDNANIVDAKTAECVGNNSMLYVKQGCPFCETQKEMFGENLKYINVVDCSKEQAKCDAEGIEKVPTWIINEQKYVGLKSADELKQLIGC